MEIINRRQRMSSVSRKIRREQDRTIGLVPTMGALHEGHLSLVREARRMCDVVVVSVFVNPAQFGPTEDYEHYPRDLTKDTAILTDYNVDYIFAPSPEEMYPKDFSTYVNVGGISKPLEGEREERRCEDEQRRLDACALPEGNLVEGRHDEPERERAPEMRAEEPDRLGYELPDGTISS